MRRRDEARTLRRYRSALERLAGQAPPELARIAQDALAGRRAARSRELRSYMAYDEVAGPGEGACLVFAFNAREARRLAWPVLRGWDTQDFTDVRARWLRSGCAHLRRQDGPHVVESPPACVRCERWYSEPLTEAGLCNDCTQEIEDGDEW